MAYHAPFTHRGKTRKYPQYAWVWPKDGKRTSTLGRWADIFSDRGPDIHVATHRGYAGNKNLGWDAPTRAQWSRWAHLPNYDAWNNNSTVSPPFWARRAADNKYDFQSRRWQSHRPWLWSDVEWETGARTNAQVPRWYKDTNGKQYRVQAQWVGGGPGANGTQW